MTRSGSWDDLPDLVTDEVLDTLVPQATWDDDLPDTIASWFGGLDVDGVILPLPEVPARDPTSPRSSAPSRPSDLRPVLTPFR